MPATFDTWAALYTAMKDALADYVDTGKFIVREYTINTATGTRRRLEYATFEELQKGLEFAKKMADTETATAVGRTHAETTGGRW